VEVDAHGLATALGELAANVSENFGVRCIFRSHGLVTLEDDMKAHHLFLIAREACTNSLKHGHAKHIEIRLDTKGDLLILRILDDGIGLPQQPSEGLGLRIMRNRSRVIQAGLRIGPVEPHGTLVTCTLHKEHADEADQVEASGGQGPDRR
jgi:signal transduction histidine kinase